MKTSNAIDRITLINFQGHKKLVIDLEPCTTIIGPSDSGKSSIIRALRWVCLNKPSGIEFLRHGSKNVSVSLWVDGTKVLRKRNTTNNIYSMLVDGEKEARIYRSFVRGVPTDIEEVLRVSDYNFQSQHDSHFWFSLSPPQLSKELNKMVQLDQMDDAMQVMNLKTRRAKAEFEVSQDRLVAARKVKRKLAWVAMCSQDLAAVLKLEAKVTKRQRQVEELGSLVQEMAARGEHIAQLSKAASAAMQVAKCGQSLQYQREECKALKNGVLAARTMLTLQQTQLPDESIVQALAKQHSTTQKLTKQKEDLWDILFQIEPIQRELQECRKKLKELKSKRLELVQEGCPLCGSSLIKQ